LAQITVKGKLVQDEGGNHSLLVEQFFVNKKSDFEFEATEKLKANKK